MIKPTIGRVVWFWPGLNSGMADGGDQPLAAIVCHVWSDYCVNLSVHDANGHQHAVTSVPLYQNDGQPRPDSFFCEWMPYQIGQAQKAQTENAA